MTSLIQPRPDVPEFMDNSWSRPDRTALRLSFVMLDDLGLPSMRYGETLACPQLDETAIRDFAGSVGQLIRNTILKEYGFGNDVTDE